MTFTGSVRGGKQVAIAAAADLKRVTLELGGNDAAIVLDDVDVEDVAAKLVGLAFFNTGQACALPKRIYIDDSIYDDMVDACAVVAAASKVGPPSDATSQLGPLSTRPQFELVSDLVADALAQGLHAVTGGSPVDAGVLLPADDPGRSARLAFGWSTWSSSGPHFPSSAIPTSTTP